MKYLKLFEGHITEEQVARICRRYDIRNWTLNSDGTVDVDGDVDLRYEDLRELPLNFGRIEGDFWCNYNKLTSLEGSPNYVGSCFICNHNYLTSLKGCPKYVDDYFDFEDNYIRNFEDVDIIKSDFYCYNNPIYYLWILFQDTSKIDTFNEWGVIQNDQVILYRLNDFLQEIGKNDVTEDQLIKIRKIYNIV